MSAAEERREIHYSGHVQGVGFRYVARMIAARHPVRGYVMNLSDGRVRLVAEGAAVDLDRFVSELEAELERHIAGKETVVESARGECAGFEIRR